jgi:signal transduction histidine kinase
MRTNTVFHKHLRAALNHIYDNEYLRQCELALDMGVADRFDVPTALRKILADAIDALKPSSGEPIGSTPHQVYDVLLYRYVQQFEQDEVAHQLGVSERHMRRIQNEALDELACRLWEQYKLEDRQIVDSGPAVGRATQPAQPKGDTDDLSWLKGDQPERVSDTKQALTNIMELTRPLATQHQVELEFLPCEEIPDLAIHPVALRQIMLNLLGVDK